MPTVINLLHMCLSKYMFKWLVPTLFSGVLHEMETSRNTYACVVETSRCEYHFIAYDCDLSFG